MSLAVNDDEISFVGEAVMMGPYGIPITVTSADGGSGVFTLEGEAGYAGSTQSEGAIAIASLEGQIDRDDPYFFTNTRSLLPFDADMNDVSAFQTPWIAGNGTSIDAVNKKYGSGSLKLTGAGGHTSSDIRLGTGDFTMEGWFYIDASVGSTSRDLFTMYTSGSSYSTLYWQGSSKALQFWHYPSVLTSNTTVVPTAQWVHVALSRSGGTLRAFQNGTQVFSIASTQDLTRNVFVVGGQDAASTTEAWIGNIDDVRITVGVGRYTANFTPPTKAYPSNK